MMWSKIHFNPEIGCTGVYHFVTNKFLTFPMKRIVQLKCFDFNGFVPKVVCRDMSISFQKKTGWISYLSTGL